MDDKNDDKKGAAAKAVSIAIKSSLQSGLLERARISSRLAKSFDLSESRMAWKGIDTSGVRALQLASNARGLGMTMKAIEATRIPSLGNINSNIGVALKAVTDRQSVLGFRVQSALNMQRRPYLDMIARHLEATKSLHLAVENYELTRTKIFTDTSRLRVALAGLEVERFSRLFDTFKAGTFGIDQNLEKDFLRLSTQVSKQFKVVNTLAKPKIELGLSANIGELLARSIHAQEAILEEQRLFREERRESGENANSEAQFQRRLAYFQTLMMVLTFFWTIAVHYEGQVQDDEQAKADQAELVQMREAFENMSTQLEALQNAEGERSVREKAELKREASADAELAAIMRDIAETLREQTEIHKSEANENKSASD